MIPYEIYKTIHLTSLFLLVSGFAVAFFTQNQMKFFRIVNGIMTLLVFVSGMGLLARIGIKHAEPWPLWVKVKVIMWFLVGVGGAIVAKRFPKFKVYAYGTMMVCVFLAIYSAIYKY